MGEKYNVLNPDCACYNESAATAVVEFTYDLLQSFIKTQPLYTPPLYSLNTMLEAGEPGFGTDIDSDQLLFLGPFLTDEKYLESINSIFEAANASGTEISESLRSLYTVSW